MRTVPMMVCLLVVGLAGCQSPYRSPVAVHMAVPPDFTLEVLVDGEVDAADPRLQASKYVLEADRTLHLAVGRAALEQSYPPSRGRLDPDKAQALFDVMVEHGLLLRPSSPGAHAALIGQPLPDHAPVAPTVYHVYATAWNTTTRYVATPDESPGTVALVGLLAGYGGADVPRGHVRTWPTPPPAPPEVPERAVEREFVQPPAPAPAEREAPMPPTAPRFLEGPDGPESPAPLEAPENPDRPAVDPEPALETEEEDTP